MNTGVIPFLLICLCLKVTLANRTSFYTQEVYCLSELPMSELIQIKSSLADEEDVVEEDVQAEEISSRTFSSSLPVAQPLKRMNKKPMRRYEDYHEDKGKDTKISKIFQLSVTALSFLAFGGYLLTLIITAIRQNAMGNTGNGNVIVLSNLQGLQNYNRPKRNSLMHDAAENDSEIEKLYQGMILLSKSYTMYNIN
ncbi:uncharacterized protein LOC117163359 [Bombus vancouverensis nearcticus]|uniref:Uncharacterized protein LOC117204602 n=1 Tax=Bombus bifarius TaxID=103933 RepID=A0A6P8M930_9HYME|nr:uncharacterized protein LOC117163359 [Bombus vancouverensis nearcticus]XP_033298027.1 uncharacterized protein LOC117204602 [Bombus bifarius]XP_050474875.1 uncharacterized protein LOC126865948 [Bombus huntii]